MKKQGEELKFAVSRKPTHTGRYFQFDSNHPESQGINGLHTSIQSNDHLLIRDRRKKSRRTIIADLKNNGYSNSFVGRIARRNGRTCHNKKLSQHTQPRPIARISGPYASGTSEALARVLRKEGIQVSHKPVSTLGRFMPRPTDCLPKTRAQGVVCKIPCAKCPATYIGETNNFSQRTTQHKNDVRKFNRERSPVAEHCDVHDHPSDFANAPVIETVPQFRKKAAVNRSAIG